jgi:transposase
MPKPLSMDLRERIVEAVDNGMSRNQAAKRFGVAVSSVVRLMQRRLRFRTLEPKPMGGSKSYALADHEEAVRELVAAIPDMTVAELQNRLKAKRIRVSASAITRFLKHLDLQYKKDRSRQRARPAGHTGRTRHVAGRSIRTRAQPVGVHR